MEKKSQKGMSAQNKVMMGAGLAALGAAAAGAIFLYGTDAGKKKRKQISSWSLKMKADVMDKMGTMKDWSEEAYMMVVDNVADKYKTLKNVDAAEVALLVADLKRHWKAIKRHVDTSTAPKKKKARTPKKNPTV